MSFITITKELKQNIQKEKVIIYSSFFKTKKGEYAEDDIFLGITVPHIRKIAKKYKYIKFDIISILCKSIYHEYRMTGLFILLYKFEHTKDEKLKTKIYNFYIQHITYVNNWDLVDTTAPHILGEYLYRHPEQKDILYTYAQSDNLWKKRIAILATFRFIKYNTFDDTIHIAHILLHDTHDLIHKAVGWMLREIGKKEEKILDKFLKKHYKIMPRTMLRYAIEKLNYKKRIFYMKK